MRTLKYKYLVIYDRESGIIYNPKFIQTIKL